MLLELKGSVQCNVFLLGIYFSVPYYLCTHEKRIFFS